MNKSDKFIQLLFQTVDALIPIINVLWSRTPCANAIGVYETMVTGGSRPGYDRPRYDRPIVAMSVTVFMVTVLNYPT